MVISRLGTVLPLQGNGALWAGFPTSSAPRHERMGLTTSEITCWDALNPQRSRRSVFFVLPRFGTEESAQQRFGPWCAAARGNPGYPWGTCKAQVGILQKQSY